MHHRPEAEPNMALGDHIAALADIFMTCSCSSKEMSAAKAAAKEIFVGESLTLLGIFFLLFQSNFFRAIALSKERQPKT